MFLGSHVTPLVFVEVAPAYEHTFEESSSVETSAHISNAFVKKHLIERGRWTASGWQSSTKSASPVHISRAILGIVRLPSLHPLSRDPYPYEMVGYGFPADKSHLQCVVTDSTLVRILPSQKLHSCRTNARDYERSGELPTPPLDPSLKEELRHNQDAMLTLKLRMATLLSTPVVIGTTYDALENDGRKRRRSLVMQEQIQIYSGEERSKRIQKRTPRVDGALAVHSPSHGAGKTLLVRSIAEDLGCRVHVIEAAPLLGKYGIHADAALETLIHSIVTSAAVVGERLCILLDHLAAFGPMSKTPDASLPILTSMSSYLSTLTKSIHQKQYVPFPTKNPLYNLGGSNGRLLPVHLCIVGVTTCPDGDQSGRSQQDVLTMLQGGRYRLPDLTTEGRIRALSTQLANIPLSHEAMQRLPGLVASRVGLHGRDFRRIQQQLMQLAKREVTAEDLADALSSVQQTKTAQYEVVIKADGANDTQDLFASVGGNTEAKLALQDALAMDPKKRRALHNFGMTPPAGVLLYGPPGTGKTLLARAVAKLLASAHTGGAFFSLQASDIVRSEVGNSEKELVAAFATARANAPSVIFIDEFQALFTERSGGSGGQLASTLLHCMDDINRWEDSDKLSENESLRIVVMGATNTPWLIDKAFLRSGRFDKVVHVGLPTHAERKSILQVHIRHMRLAVSENHRDELCITLANQTVGFSGADMAALCRSAAVRCLQELGEDGLVDEHHFLEGLQHDIAASSSKYMVDKLSRWKP